jgi:hypothetical protein
MALGQDGIGTMYDLQEIITKDLLDDEFIKSWMKTILNIFPIKCKKSAIVHHSGIISDSDEIDEHEKQYYAIIYKQCGRIGEHLMYYDMIPGEIL